MKIKYHIVTARFDPFNALTTFNTSTSIKVLHNIQQKVSKVFVVSLVLQWIGRGYVLLSKSLHERNIPMAMQPYTVTS